MALAKVGRIRRGKRYETYTVITAPSSPALDRLLGLTAATMPAVSWTQLGGRLIQAQRTEAKAEAT